MLNGGQDLKNLSQLRYYQAHTLGFIITMVALDPSKTIPGEGLPGRTQEGVGVCWR